MKATLFVIGLSTGQCRLLAQAGWAESVGITEFIAFPSDAGAFSANNFWTGSAWDWFGGSVTSLDRGQSALIVRSQTAFTARYGAGFNIAGQYLGAEHFLAQTDMAPAQANAGPKDGPVVISESHFSEVRV